MAATTHRIRHQRWLCSAGSAAEAFALRGGLREAQEAAVPAVFERAFDAAVPGDEVVHLPRLEVSIRLANVDDLAAALPGLLARAVSEQLGHLLAPRSPLQIESQIESQIAPRIEPRSGPAIRPRDSRLAPAGDGLAPVPAGTRRSSRDSRLEGLIEYLNAGTLPWELAHAETSALLEQFRETLSADLAVILAQAPFSQRPAFFFRLFQLLPRERWEEVERHLSSRDLPAELTAGWPARGLAGALAERLGARAAESLEQERQGQQEQQGLQGHQGLQGRQGLQAQQGLEGQQESQEQSHERRRRNGSVLVPEVPGVSKVPEVPAVPEVPVSSLPASPGAAIQAGSPPIPDLTPAESLFIAGATVETFPIAVRCAGLVILHPFLPRLFESTGILRAGEPGLPWTELPRAAALLHWLATGRDEVHEFELGFVKILLGRRPEETLLVDGGLLAAGDREEGEALLQAAVQHWRALKGTTPAGLRASFLQRGGLLRDDDAGWRLHVEPAAFDLLLDHLPWGIGVVKLPWMTRPIFTEWPTT